MPFEAALIASGGQGTFTWTLTSGALPPGVTLQPDGKISGEPTVPGKYAFVSTVKDGEGRTVNVNSTIVVAAKLLIAPQRLAAAKVGRPYRARITITGGVAPKTWSVRGKLPQGVTFATKLGILLGTPRKPGTYRFTVEVADAFGVSASKRLTLVVK